mgnify:CR=1 FL=1
MESTLNEVWRNFKTAVMKIKKWKPNYIHTKKK